mmetsp:Transcript_23700/g.57531  ORF Transcript_23700/g.57531 Transcript_23700/m.57531 type:complete len:239 (-) Transcript_23700:19-735(-)
MDELQPFVRDPRVLVGRALARDRKEPLLQPVVCWKAVAVDYELPHRLQAVKATAARRLPIQESQRVLQSACRRWAAVQTHPVDTLQKWVPATRRVWGACPSLHGLRAEEGFTSAPPCARSSLPWNRDVHHALQPIKTSLGLRSGLLAFSRGQAPKECGGGVPPSRPFAAQISQDTPLLLKQVGLQVPLTFAQDPKCLLQRPDTPTASPQGHSPTEREPPLRVGNQQQQRLSLPTNHRG